MNKKVKGIVAVAVTAVILAGTLFACSRKSDTPKSTDSSLTTSVTKEEQSSKTNKTDKSDKSEKTSKTDKSEVKETSDEVKDNSTKSENQSGKTDKSHKSGKTDKKPENKKPEQTKSQKETKRNNATQGTTKRQTQSTTRKQTQNTTQRQTQSTTKRQTQSTTRSTTKSTTARPADKVEYKTETKDYSISYRTVDNYSSTGAESRVYQQGKNGTGRKTYKVKYVNGVRQGAELVSDTVVTQAQDHIIERYVQVEAGGTKRVPKKYIEEDPVYKDFWFANCVVPETGEARQEWFESAKEAADYHTYLNSSKNECHPTNWGGPQARQVGTKTVEVDGWETIEVPAKFEWKH